MRFESCGWSAQSPTMLLSCAENPASMPKRRADLAVHMRQAVGFRNVLVHEYVEVDDRIVLDRLTDLDDLDRFVEQVAA